VHTLKEKSMATIVSKTTQKGPTKGYWQDLLKLANCKERKEESGVSIVEK